MPSPAEPAQLDPFVLVFGESDGEFAATSAISMIVIAIIAYRRFMQLEVSFDTWQFKRNTRIWTTGIRFVASALVYIAVSLFAFRLLIEAPTLLAYIGDQIGGTDLADDLNLKSGDSALLVPIVAVAVLYGAPKIHPFRAVDAGIRASLQRTGAIPRRVRILMNRLEGSHIVLSDDEKEPVRQALPASLSLDLLNKKQDLLKSKMVRATTLHVLISRWSRADHEFNPYYKEHERAVEEVQKACKEVLHDFDNFAKYSDSLDEKTAADERKKITDRLEEVLLYQHMAFSSALLSQLWRGRINSAILKHQGFSEKTPITPKEPKERRSLLMDSVLSISNDLGLVALLCLVVIFPVLFILLYFALAWLPTDFVKPWMPGDPSEDGLDPEPIGVILLLWPIKILVLLAGAILPALHTQVIMLVSDRRFWRKVREKAGRHYITYFLAGIYALAVTFVVLTLLNLFDPTKPLGGDAFLQAFGTALFAFAVAVATTFNFETLGADEWLAWLNAAAIGASGMVFGTIGFAATHGEGAQNWPYVVVILFAMGITVGKVVPAVYRERVEPLLTSGTGGHPSA